MVIEFSIQLQLNEAHAHRSVSLEHFFSGFFGIQKQKWDLKKNTEEEDDDEENLYIQYANKVTISLHNDRKNEYFLHLEI